MSISGTIEGLRKSCTFQPVSTVVVLLTVTMPWKTSSINASKGSLAIKVHGLGAIKTTSMSN